MYTLEWSNKLSAMPEDLFMFSVGLDKLNTTAFSLISPFRRTQVNL